jgi:hypothetical protein
MFGFAVLLAALQFAGAPAGIPTFCVSAFPADEHGETTYINGAPAVIGLSSPTCAGVTLLAASPLERKKIAALNPSVNVSTYAGEAALVILLEAAHASHPDQGADETDDACKASAAVSSFLGRYLSGSDLASALNAASALDSRLPAVVYHTHPCP